MSKPLELTVKLMYKPKAAISRHLIFIHGLSGDPIKTWLANNDNDEFWPVWFAETAEDIAIWTVGYPADKVKWNNGQAMPPTDRGSSIYNALLPKTELDRGELCFIGHSMGGVLIKQIILEAESESKSNQRAQDFVNRIKRVCFIGTPHAGSFISSLGNAFSIISKPSEATKGLGSENPSLRDLNKKYRNIAEIYKIDHLTLYETQKHIPYKRVPFIKLSVVPPSSADAGVGGKVIPIDADHEMICKPSSTESQVYQLIKTFLDSDESDDSNSLRIENKIDSILESTESINRILPSAELMKVNIDNTLFDNELQKN
jgi:hypothetical protein